MTPDAPPGTYSARTVFSVSELNAAARALLEASFGLLWVEGEISNIARPRSGHLYFSLKDDRAQVRCALFKNQARLLRAALDNGSQIRVRARASLYTARGDYQLIVEHVEDAGDGALLRAFEQLKARLDAEGLFDPARKRAIPNTPARIGVITSATGAAIRDVCSVAARRYPLGALRIYPVAVQGESAPAAIVAALERAGARGDCDVLILARGGGSLEDLQAFNDERVARAIAACPLPVVAGVGHEIDVTIADFVADVRAATPSAAAELVCPDLGAQATRLPALEARLTAQLNACVEQRRRTLAGLTGRLARQHPRRRLEIPTQRLDEAEQRLQRSVRQRLARGRERQTQGARRLYRITPSRRIIAERERIAALDGRLARAQRRILRETDQRLAGAMRALHTVSPLRTLERGYAVARDPSGQVLRRADAACVGERITVDLAHGRLDCDVRGASARPDIRRDNDGQENNDQESND